MNIKEWKYAPVIIPTCNRVQHLKNCLESLNNNKYADRTDVYISVDYPPGDIYVNGHSAVVDYLHWFKANNRFKNLYVFIQEKNLGVSKNFRFVIQQAVKEYDYYISTEDDNIFASNFLEYCNLCLRKFRDDKKVHVICGYNDVMSHYVQGENRTNIVLRKYYEPYGSATWKSKYLEYQKWRTMDNIYAAALNFSMMMGLRNYNRSVFNLFVMGILVAPGTPFVDPEGNLNDTDVMYGVFLYFNDKFAVYPGLNLTHSNGNDGSGVNVTTECPDTRPIMGESLLFEDDLKVQVDLDARRDRYTDRFSIVQYIRHTRPTVEYIRWFWKNRRAQHR